MSYIPIDSSTDLTTRDDMSPELPNQREPGLDELTEEEREEYEKGILTWSKVRNWRFWIRREWTWYYLGFVLLVVVVALMAFFHHSVSPLHFVFC
jgi:hypothetical protein